MSRRRCCCTTTAKGYLFGGYTSVGVPNASNQEYDSGGNSWASKTGMTAGRAQHAVGAVNGKGYVACGVDTASAKQQTLYEYVVDSWSTKTSSPTPARAACAGAGDATDLYVSGGADATSTLTDLDAYNQSGDSWTSKTSMPSPDRNQHAFAYLGAYIYACGGVQSGPTYLRDTDRYDPSGDSWSAKTDIPTPARAVVQSGTALDSKLYITGGNDGSSYYADHEEYVEDSWTSKTDMASGVRLVGGSCTLGSALYAMSGFKSAAPFFLTTHESYVVDTWSSKMGVPNARYYSGAVPL